MRLRISRPPMVEIWFDIVERQAILRAFIDGWNDRGHRFVWTKTTDQILAKAKRPTITSLRSLVACA
jgi:hypothetical protein